MALKNQRASKRTIKRMEDAKLAKLHSNLASGESNRGFRGGLGKSIATLKTAKSAKSHLYLGNFVREGEGSYKNWNEEATSKKKAKEKVYGWIESERSQERLDQAKASGLMKKSSPSSAKKRRRSASNGGDAEPSAEFISNEGTSLSWKKVCKKILKKADGKRMKLKPLVKAMKEKGVGVKRKELKAMIKKASKFTIEKKWVSYEK